jgi:hypothetical protein
MEIFSDFPAREELLRWQQGQSVSRVLSVNGHVHTPYSFSAFEDIGELFIKASKEGIKVLGINDFYTADGYADFYRLACQHRIFPLFNIELIGLLIEEQQKGIRVNDPNNPGRTYFSGKGLRFPFSMNQQNHQRLMAVRSESQVQVKEMTVKLSQWLHSIGAPFNLTFEEIKQKVARELVRERHIVKMLRIKMNQAFHEEKEKREFLAGLFGGKESKADLDNHAAVEEELRGNLLKTGGVAFIPEDPSAFLPIPDIIGMIVDAGGIPCYPVLLDDKNGNYTGFEQHADELHRRLLELNIGMIELIPVRNDFHALKAFTEYFEQAGFVILYGTEHNTPEMIPLTVTTRGKVPLDDWMHRISYEGCCVVAAHQYLLSKGEQGFLDAKGNPRQGEKKHFIDLGRAVIEKFITS